MTLNSRCVVNRLSAGFSLVELLTALVFTMILKAGMAGVFKSSLSTAIKANEQLSNLRRNRMSLDMIYDDLNNMGMYLLSLTKYPNALTSSSPGFFVTPNVSYAATGLDVQGVFPSNWIYPASTGDELNLYFDEPLPYDAILRTTLTGLSSQVDSGAAISDSSTFDVEFKDGNQAAEVKTGMYVIFQDAWDVKQVTNVPPPSTTPSATIQITASGATGSGGYDDASGAPTGATPLNKAAHISGKNVLIVDPGRKVRYSIRTRKLDPESPSKPIPCLIREEGAHGGSFDSTKTNIIAENVIGFKVFISADRGTTWAGSGFTTTSTSGAVGPWNDLATSGKFRKILDSSLSGGRPGWTDTSNPNWFREIPVIVRIDLLTRTMQKRTEYGNQSATSPTADYGTRFQSLILVPRHTGLPLS